ncbi:MAG TPA: hypothetical protein DGG94_06550 [Micromonosporaceae bacterium]|nr:hypothetical protein [Micromonosporaceae bacterium]HCU49449.1 hypothetical protein [Micromonosporaceae bacterium]
MRLFAHTWPDGSVEAFIAVPDGDAMAMAMPPAGAQLCEITEHDLTAENFDFERLARMRDEYTVDLTPGTGRLIRRGSEKAP